MAVIPPPASVAVLLPAGFVAVAAQPAMGVAVVGLPATADAATVSCRAGTAQAYTAAPHGEELHGAGLARHRRTRQPRMARNARRGRARRGLARHRRRRRPRLARNCTARACTTGADTEWTFLVLIVITVP